MRSMKLMLCALALAGVAQTATAAGPGLPAGCNPIAPNVRFSALACEYALVRQTGELLEESYQALRAELRKKGPGAERALVEAQRAWWANLDVEVEFCAQVTLPAGALLKNPPAAAYGTCYGGAAARRSVEFERYLQLNQK